MPGDFRPVQFDEQVGNFAGPVDRRIFHFANGLECGQDLGGFGLQDFIVLAEHFDDDLPADAADGLFDVVRDRLGEVEHHAGDLGDLPAHGLDEPDLGPSGRPVFLGMQVDERLALVGPDRVGAVLGAALFGQDVRDLRKLRQEATNLGQEALALRQGDGVRHLDVDVEVPFVQHRQELRSESGQQET